MSREIPIDRKLEVVKLYLEGFAYDDIVKSTGGAKGSVAAIVEALRAGEFPQFEQVTDLVNELRELTVGLRKAGITIIEAAPLFILVKKLLGLGVEPQHLESWVKMCRAVPEGEFSRSQIIQAASKLAKLEQEGLSYEQTLEGLRSSSAELERLGGEVAELRAEEPKLHARKEELIQANRHLEAEHIRLQGMLNAMALREKEQENRLQELGEQVKQCQEEIAQLETEKNKLGRETSQFQERALALEKQVIDKTETLTNLGEEVTRGMRESASRGFYVASYAPYGYRKVKVTDGGRERPRLEIEDYQAQVVRRIFENVIKGKGLIDISKELNREGITAPRSNSWGKTTLHKILTNEAYTGTLLWGQSSIRNLPPVRLENAWAAIVSHDTFKQVQALLRERAFITIHHHTPEESRQ